MRWCGRFRRGSEWGLISAISKLAPGFAAGQLDWLYGYDPATGRELWRVNYGVLGFSVVPRPVMAEGLAFLSTSFMKPQLLAVKYEGVSKPEIAWSFKRNVSQQPSPILVGDEIYFVSDRAGMVTCVDALTGKEHWRERIAGTYSSSPTHANGRIYFHSRTGDTTVLQAGKEFKKLAKNSLDGELMATAAVDAMQASASAARRAADAAAS